jgi:hypothetical protein
MSARSRNPTTEGFGNSASPLRPLCVPHQWNTVEQLAGFLGRKHRSLAFSDDVFRAAHGVGWIDLDDVADHEPVEQHTQRRQVLLDRGRRELTLKLLDERCDMRRLDRGQLFDAARLAPVGEAPRGIHVRLARMVVVDLGRDKFEEAPGGLGCRGKEGEGSTGGGRGGDESGGSWFGFWRGIYIECYKKRLSHTKRQGEKFVVNGPHDEDDAWHF